MNSKELIHKATKLKEKTSPSPKSTFPKVKMDGFYEAATNTNMLEMVEEIKSKKTNKVIT